MGLCIASFACFFQVPPVLTGTEILGRCQLAYDSVQTLDQRVRGSVGSSTITARVRFRRPGMFSVTGRAMDKSAYRVVSNGHSTFVRDHGHWTKAKNIEDGIGMITGLGGIPGCTVPCTLLHFSWSALRYYRESWDSKTAVTPCVINGRQTFRVSVTSPQPTTIWIDSKTYFVVRILTPLAGKTHADTTFDAPVINNSIPAKAFRQSR